MGSPDRGFGLGRRMTLALAEDETKRMALNLLLNIR